jgi:hypothetical protein
LFPTDAQDGVLPAICVSDAHPATEAQAPTKAMTAMTRAAERTGFDLMEIRFTAALLDKMCRAPMTVPENFRESSSFANVQG